MRPQRDDARPAYPKPGHFPRGRFLLNGCGQRLTSVMTSSPTGMSRSLWACGASLYMKEGVRFTENIN
jgi:hypothetical protein